MNTQTYCIYRHTSPSGKAYIGQTCDYARRIAAHKGMSLCRAFYNAVKKYGFDSFKHEILIDGLTLEEANLLEDFFIVEHNTLSPHGYNLKTGGGNGAYSEESKRLMAEKRQAYWVNNPESRKVVSERSKIQFSSTEARAAASVKSKTYWLNNNEARLAQSKIKKSFYAANPEAKLAHSKRHIAYFSNPEAKLAASERATIQFLTQEAKLAQSERLKAYWLNPEALLAKSEITKAYFKANPQAGIDHSKKVKAHYANNPENGLALAEKKRAFLAIPINKTRIRTAQALGWAKKAGRQFSYLP